MNNKQLKIAELPNRLLMVDHDERGTWYFTNLSRAARWIGKQRTELEYVLLTKNVYEWKGYKFEWVDGTNVIYKYIDPSNK